MYAIRPSLFSLLVYYFHTCRSASTSPHVLFGSHPSIHTLSIYPDIKQSWLSHLPSIVSLLNFESSMQKICRKIWKWKSPHYKLRESSQKRAYGAESAKNDEIFLINQMGLSYFKTYGKNIGKMSKPWVLNQRFFLSNSIFI